MESAGEGGRVSSRAETAGEESREDTAGEGSRAPTAGEESRAETAGTDAPRVNTAASGSHPPPTGDGDGSRVNTGGEAEGDGSRVHTGEQARVDTERDASRVHGAADSLGGGGGPRAETAAGEGEEEGACRDTDGAEPAPA